MTTCQICGRAIKTVKAAQHDVIAHHGYRRPGHGWQTASCFGARWRPYEVACDALPPAIVRTEEWLEQAQDAYDEWLLNPPETIAFQERDAWMRPRGEPVMLRRPDGFDGPGAESNYVQRSYAFQYISTRETMRSQVRMAKEDLAGLRKRLALWKAP